ncbi:MAG TPA: lipid A deacylase LpxR family protein [Acidiphilium sp.]
MTRNLVLIVCCATPLLSLTPLTARAGQGFPAGIWTIQDENASISTQSNTDRFYVNGFHLGWTSHESAVPSWLADFGHAVLGAGEQRISIGLTQKIFTPEDTVAIDPPLRDEPYAGSLLAEFDLIQDTAHTRTVLGFDAGVFGRDAGAEIVQNDFHTVIGQKGTHGWAYQLPSEPAFDVLLSRTWRVPLGGSGGGIEADVLPQFSAMVGTTEIYAQPAVTFRIGQGLDSDFGAPLLRPGPTGSDAYRPTRPFVWYVFGGIAGKLVGHDEYLQGTDFETSRSVDPYRAVGQFEAGVAIIWRGIRFSYTQVFQTRRFYGQNGGVHEYGSFAVSARF